MKKLITLFTILSVLAATADNTRYGAYAGSAAVNCDNNEAYGESAMAGANAAYRNVFIGGAAGAATKRAEGNVAIGKNALFGTQDITGAVAIGNDELAGESWNCDTTSINKKQLWISGPLEAFCLNPRQETNITNTPLYYINDTLYINASRISSRAGGIGGGGYAATGKFDLYLAEWGNDQNLGTEPNSPFRTMERCYEAATNDARVGVYAGTYNPPLGTHGFMGQGAVVARRMTLLNPAHKLTFVAMSGKENTFIVGGDYAEGELVGEVRVGRWNKSLAFYSGYHSFIGFTISNFDYVDFGGMYEQNPLFCCVYLEDCIVIGKDDATGFADENARLTLITSCYFKNTVFRNLKLRFTAGGSYRTIPIMYTDFEGCRIEDLLYVNLTTNGYSYWQPIRYDCTLTDTAIRMANGNPVPFKNPANNVTFNHCTMLATNRNIATSYMPKSYSQNGVYSAYDMTNDVEGANVYVSRSLVNDDMVASSIDSKAVRTDGERDYGWKDSGLSLKKVLQRDVRLSLVNGVVTAYTNGVAIGTLSLTPIATEERQFSPNLSPPSWNGQPTSDDDGDGTNVYQRLNVSF